MNSQLLVVLLIAVIAVNGLPADKFPNGLGAKEYDHGVHESSDERLQWKDLNLVDSDEDYTKEPEPLDRLGSQMLNFEDEKIQNEIELRNGPNTTTAEPSGGDCESNGGECKKNKKQCKATITTEFTCSSKGVCCIEEVKAQGASELMLQMLANTILIQGMAMQTLKEDQENSMSNLTNIIVNLKQTVEIKNSNLSDAIANQGMALKINQDSIKSNLSDISNQGMALQINQNTIMSNLTDQEDMIESIEDNQDVIISKLTHIGCPEGFMLLPVTGQCFKLYKDSARTWTAAKSKCETDGLSLAETDYPIALRRAIMQTYGATSYYSWVGAKGDGSYVRWQSNNAIIPTGSSNYWYSTSVSSSYCVVLMTNSYLSSSYRDRPFYSITCTSTAYALCEYV